MAAPTDITGLINRWRADSIAQTTGTAVSTWAALTGGVSWSQATGGSQPTYVTGAVNGQPVVRFNGTAQYMTATLAATTAQPVTISFVFKAASIPTAGNWAQLFDSNNTVEVIWGNGSSIDCFAGADLIDSTTHITTTGFHVLTFVANGASSASYWDGTQIATGSSGTNGLVTACAIGRLQGSASRFAGMDLAEIVVYNKVLSTAERATLDTYVFQQYGVVSSDASTTTAPTAAGSVDLGGGTVTARAAATTAGTVTISGAATTSSTASASAAGSVDLGGSAAATVPPPPPAPTPAPVAWPPIPQPGARWTWAVGPWSSLPTGELPNATARSLKLALAGTSSVSFTVDGTTTDAAQVQELVTDVWCMRNGVTLFRGRVGPTTDDLDGSKHTVSVTAGDYRALLQRRILYDVDTLTYTNTEQTGIGANLIGSTQSHPGGNLFITGVPNTTNVTRTIAYPAGQSIGQAIETLSQMDNGFNWDILPTTGQVGQTFRVWASRGDNKERVLSYPGNLVSVRRQVDPGAYANAVRETGGTDAANNQIAPVSLDASDVTLRAEGRWDKQAGDTSLIDAPSLTAHANYDLAISQQITPTYTVVMQPGEWGGPTDVWLGDAVLLHVSSGRVNVLGEPLRVWEIGIDLDDADNETVTLTLAALDPTKRDRARRYDQRLTALERR